MVTVDLSHGGRWTSLRTGDREWLWSRPDPARDQARPGQPFIDAGGLEECIPTVRGAPDHGAVWPEAWRALDDATAVVDVADFTLTRTIRCCGRPPKMSDPPGLLHPTQFRGGGGGGGGDRGGGDRGGGGGGGDGGGGEDGGGGHARCAVIADYRLTAVPGYRFVWVAHALLELSEAARLDAPAGTVTRVFDASEDAPWLSGEWPAPLGLPLSRFGPWDGTAVGAVLLDCPRVAVVDGPDRLTFTLTADGQPVSTALWRNLGGFPQPSPYRSIGVEPMLGRVFDLASAGPGDAAVVPASGVCEWRLEITA
jgi:hypothetical protein